MMCVRTKAIEEATRRAAQLVIDLHYLASQEKDPAVSHRLRTAADGIHEGSSSLRCVPLHLYAEISAQSVREYA